MLLGFRISTQTSIFHHPELTPPTQSIPDARTTKTATMSACEKCNKSPPEVSLKHCAQCSTTPYCSRECQKADWKVHKKLCGKQTSESGTGSTPGTESNPTSQPGLPKGLDRPTSKPFNRLDNGTWLHDRPEKDVFRLLIDAYRMRVEDMYTFEGDADEDSIYSGNSDGITGFKRFLAAVERAQNGKLLPGWWTAEKKAECVAFGANGGDWSNLNSAVEKSDINEHYGDPRSAMQLRMFAEAVYGHGPGGSDGTSMRKALAAMEGGGM